MSKQIAKPVLPIRGKDLRFVKGQRKLLDGIDIEFIPESGITVVIGPNGAGKSLLLRMLAGLLTPSSGSVRWAGDPADSCRVSRIGFVLQRPVLLRRSARANLEFALAVRGIPRRSRSARASEALELAGLLSLADSPAPSMSGGEKQRLALARAIMLNPDCLLLDEPTSNLDPASIQAFENQLWAARKSGTAMMLVTQDLGQVRRLADRIIFLHNGRILEDASAARFFETRPCEQAEAFFNGTLAV